MVKITVQQMKGDFKSTMGTTFAEYSASLPVGFTLPETSVKVENCTYTRVGKGGKTLKVLAVILRENDRVISGELYCE